MKNTKIVFGILLLFILVSFGSIVSATAPVLSNEVPNDGSTLIGLTLTSVNVTMSDVDSDINWTIDFTPDIGNSSGTLGKNGSKTCAISGLQYSTTYTWVVSAMDSNATGGASNFTNATYTFTTRSQQRLSEHTTDPSQILLVTVLATVLFLGLVVYVMKSIKDKTFKLDTFIKILIAVIVITIAVSFL